MAYSKEHRYQLITWSNDSGQDEKKEFPTMKAATEYYKRLNTEVDIPYDGAGIWDHLLKTYRAFIGYYPERLRT